MVYPVKSLFISLGFTPPAWLISFNQLGSRVSTRGLKAPQTPRRRHQPNRSSRLKKGGTAISHIMQIRENSPKIRINPKPKTRNFYPMKSLLISSGRNTEHRTPNKEQGTRNNEQGTTNNEQGTTNNEQRTRNTPRYCRIILYYIIRYYRIVCYLCRKNNGTNSAQI